MVVLQVVRGTRHPVCQKPKPVISARGGGSFGVTYLPTRDFLTVQQQLSHQTVVHLSSPGAGTDGRTNERLDEEGGGKCQTTNQLPLTATKSSKLLKKKQLRWEVCRTGAG